MFSIWAAAGLSLQVLAPIETSGTAGFPLYLCRLPVVINFNHKPKRARSVDLNFSSTEDFPLNDI